MSSSTPSTTRLFVNNFSVLGSNCCFYSGRPTKQSFHFYSTTSLDYFLSVSVVSSNSAQITAVRCFRLWRPASSPEICQLPLLFGQKTQLCCCLRHNGFDTFFETVSVFYFVCFSDSLRMMLSGDSESELVQTSFRFSFFPLKYMSWLYLVNGRSKIDWLLIVVCTPSLTVHSRGIDRSWAVPLIVVNWTQRCYCNFDWLLKCKLYTCISWPWKIQTLQNL